MMLEEPPKKLSPGRPKKDGSPAQKTPSLPVKSHYKQLIELQRKLSIAITDPKAETSVLPSLIRSWLDIQAELRLLTGRSFGPLTGPLPKAFRGMSYREGSDSKPSFKGTFQAPAEPTEPDNPEP